MSWKGTAVPNSGTVDKLYFNDKVSFQEIYNLLSSIEYAPFDDTGFFEVYIALNCDGGSSFGVIKKNNTDTPRGIEYDINVDDELFWTSVNDEGFTSYGLNVLAIQQNYGYIPNTGEALDKDSIGDKEYEVGLQNDKISSIFSITPFEEVQEEVTLDSWAEDIADAIREKKGIEKKEEWVGTEVPATGYIDKFYLNTNLSIEEVVDTIINNVTNALQLMETAYIGYLVYADENYTNGVVAMFDTETGKVALFGGNSEGTIYFFTSSEIEETDFVGWNPNFNGIVEFNNTQNENTTNVEVGVDNYKITNLLSLTPFEKKTTGLIPRLNFAQEIRSIEAGELLSPTAVPISGMVEKVYFNFNVDVLKIGEMVLGLSYVQVPGVGNVYPIISNADMSSGLVLVKESSDNCALTYSSNGQSKKLVQIAYSNNDASIFIYDDNDFTKPLEFGFENMVSQLVTQFPTYVNSNELLKEMISITPIQKIGSGSIEGIIEVEELPEIQQQFVPNSGFVEKININTTLSYDEVQDILSNSFDNVLSDIVNVNGKDYTPLGIIAIDENNYILISGSFSNTEGNKFGIEGVLNGTDVTLFDRDNGWTTEGLNTKSIELNSEVVSYIDSISIYFGKYNEQLTRLFSINSKEQEFDVSKIYYLNQKMGDICAYTGSFWTSMKDLVENNGGKVYAIVVKDKPTENIKVTDLNSMIMYAYFVENENDIFLYADWSGEGNPSWLSFSVAMFSGEVTYGGQITDVSEATDPTKYYTMAVQKFYKYSNGWVEYKYGGIIPDGSLTVTQNGEYDITSYKTVDVNIEDKSLEVHKTYLFSKSINWQSISWDKFNFTLSLNGHIFREKTITGLDSGKLIIPKCVSSIGEYCFYHCRSIAEVSFDGNSCVSIGQWCFSGCDKLTSIIFPDDIKTIPISVASGCDLLTNVVLPKNCTRIERNAFEICNNLTYVEIPATVVSIGRQAFNAVSDNDKLLTVKMLGSTPPTLEDTSMGFSLVFLVDKILIPSGSLTAFEQSWSLYVGKFEEY